MKPRLLHSLLVSTLICVLQAGMVYADFDLVGRIPAPDDCGWPTIVTGLASDGEYLLVSTNRLGISRVYLISPETGDVLKSADFGAGTPGCPLEDPQIISAAYDPLSGNYWVGDMWGSFIAFTWVGDDAVQIEASFDPDEILVASGLEFEEPSTLYALNSLCQTLVEVSTSGDVGDAYPLPGIWFPSGLAKYGGNLFAVAVTRDVVFEMSKQAELIEIHALNPGLLGGPCGPTLHAAAFHDGFLYLGGSSDSISIFGFSSGIVIPEGDSVDVEAVPGELELTFETVIDSGLLYINEETEDPCPAPEGVQLFPEFYEVNTNAHFDFVVEVAVLDSMLPEGVPEEKVRVFTRPSGPCGIWRDATVEYVELIETLKILRRTRSEDDEFSFFAIAEDNRKPYDVVELKFDYLRGHIESGQDSIPPAALAQILAALDAAEEAHCKGRPLVAAARLFDLEGIVRHEPAIPHTFRPNNPGRNLAGRIISRAHTLAFSLRYLDDTGLESTAAAVPPHIQIGLRDRLMRTIVEIPEGLDPLSVDPVCVAIGGMALALPGSVSVADYDDDGDPELRAVFRQGDFETGIEGPGCRLLEITCFIDGFRVRAEANVNVAVPQIHVLGEDMLIAGDSHVVTWEAFDCESVHPYRLSFSANGGMTWEVVEAFVDGRTYDWLVPEVDTHDGLLRVTCLDQNGNEEHAYSDILIIASSAGVEDMPAHEFRLGLCPNPTSAGLTVEFASPRAQNVALDVYSVRGELVKTLFRGRMGQGVERMHWRGDNTSGHRVSPGTYFVVFRGETRTLAEKVIIQR